MMGRGFGMCFERDVDGWGKGDEGERVGGEEGG